MVRGRYMEHKLVGQSDDEELGQPRRSSGVIKTHSVAGEGPQQAARRSSPSQLECDLGRPIEVSLCERSSQEAETRPCPHPSGARFVPETLLLRVNRDWPRERTQDCLGLWPVARQRVAADGRTHTIQAAWSTLLVRGDPNKRLLNMPRAVEESGRPKGKPSLTPIPAGEHHSALQRPEARDFGRPRPRPVEVGDQIIVLGKSRNHEV